MTISQRFYLKRSPSWKRSEKSCIVVVPEAVETISYQMPAFRLKRIFFYFAAFKKHIGVYPPVSGDDDLMQALLPYRNDKGNLKFPLDQPMPYDLIGRVAEALARQHS